MDPITIGATVASLVTTCAKAGMTCNTLIGKYKSAPQTLASIQTECTTIKAALSYVYWLINRDTELLSTQLCAQGPLAETLDVALTGCTMTFSLLDSELQKLYDRGDDGHIYGKREKLRYVWDEGLATTILGNMRGLQGAVTLVLTALQTSSLIALNATLASQRPIVEQVRRDTLSICQSHSNVSQLFRSKAESDIYSIFSSTIGDEEFSFDEEIVNSQAYRRVMKHWTSKNETTPGDYKQPRSYILDEPLIDLSWPSLAGDSDPTKYRLNSMSHWFGAFEGLPQPLEPTPSSATQVTPDIMFDGGALRGVATQENGEKRSCSPAISPKKANHPEMTILAAQDRATPKDGPWVNTGDNDCSPLKGSHLEAIPQSNDPHATRNMAISKTFQSEALYSLTKNNIGNSKKMESVTSPIVSSPSRQAGSNSGDEGFGALAKEIHLITPAHERLSIAEHGKPFNHDGYIVGHIKGSDWKGDESDSFVGKLIDQNGAILDEDGHTKGDASRLSANIPGREVKGASDQSPHVSRRPPLHHFPESGSGSGATNPLIAKVEDAISRLLVDDLPTTSVDFPRLRSRRPSGEPNKDKKYRIYDTRVEGLPQEAEPSHERGSASISLRHGIHPGLDADKKSSQPSQRSRRRRRRFDGQGFSVASKDAKEVFAKHDVAPMPMGSDYVASEMTRCSILTESDEEPESSRHKAKSSNVETGLLKVNPPRNSHSGTSQNGLDSIEDRVRALILPELKGILPELKGIKQGQYERRRLKRVDAGPKASYSDNAPERRKRTPMTPPGRRSRNSYSDKAPARRDRSPVRPPGRGSKDTLVHDIEVWYESRKRLLAKLGIDDITAESVADGGLTAKTLKGCNSEHIERLSKVDGKELPGWGSIKVNIGTFSLSQSTEKPLRNRTLL